MQHEDLVTLTADIVSAYLSNNNAEIAALPGLIGAVYSSLSAAGTVPAPAPERKATPAVSIKASIKHDSITCLECGFSGKMLKRHLGTEHGLDPREYKTRWGLAKDYPLVAPAYAERRKELALKIGLGHTSGKRGGRKKAA